MPNSVVGRDPEATGAEQKSSFGDILTQFEQAHASPAKSHGDGRDGTVIAVTGDSVFVDIGMKIEGIVPAAEFRDKTGVVAIQPGDKLRVAITGRNDEGYYLLSKLKVQRPKDWAGLEKAFQEKRAIAGVVSGVVKGGLSVDIGVRAFMPASRSGAKDAAELEKLVGQEITCKIIKVDVADEDVVVDRRAILEEEEARNREQRLADLKEGTTVQGTVRTLTDFGAFVDIGGVDGLLHVTDMSWGRVNKPSDLLKPGDRVEVQVLKIEQGTGKRGRRISLGMKQLQADPWTLVAEQHKTGERVRGIVTRVADFGAFVELEPGIEGLIHVSELSWSKKVRKASDVVKPGDAVEAVVLGVNAAERRISLGLKQALGDPWAQAEKRFPVGTVVEGPITSLTKFGAFVQLDEGLEGMIHVGDISAEKRINHPQDVLKTGQAVRAAVLEVDREKRRIRLGLKQLQPTSIDEYIAEHKEGDLVSGRVANIARGRATVELGEGIQAFCNIEAAEATVAAAGADPAKADLSALSSMLAAKWKHNEAGGSSTGKSEPAREGQIRSFRIVRLDSAQKKIELKLAS
ncbi:MAG TPA: 30S ribosomal protein S1 [Bryobacteraceae bacterium]|jgi:small subunit ribosomal protein S1|nr:30S ribosomal protein S1 [Bryobacteraceae bacterium]